MGAYGAHDLVYIKTDKNGTKYYNDINCPRCSGYGELSKWEHTGRICYACGGDGKRPQPKIVKVYTPEYEAKLEARRAAKAIKKNAEKEADSKQMISEMFARSIKEMGFGENGIGYVHYGNTYRNKDLLKSKGARWSMELKAYIAPAKIEAKDVKVYEVDAATICTPAGYIDWDKGFELRKKLGIR